MYFGLCVVGSRFTSILTDNKYYSSYSIVARTKNTFIYFFLCQMMNFSSLAIVQSNFFFIFSLSSLSSYSAVFSPDNGRKFFFLPLSNYYANILFFFVNTKKKRRNVVDNWEEDFFFFLLCSDDFV